MSRRPPAAIAIGLAALGAIAAVIGATRVDARPRDARAAARSPDGGTKGGPPPANGSRDGGTSLRPSTPTDAGPAASGLSDEDRELIQNLDLLEDLDAAKDLELLESLDDSG